MAALDSMKKIMAENMDIDPETISEQTPLESLNIDSLDMVELICNLEDEEDIDFGEPDQERFVTIGDIAAYVDSLK